MISTIKDEKSAAKFRYIKTVALSIAFRVVSVVGELPQIPLQRMPPVTIT